MHGIRRRTRIAELGASSRLDLLRATEIKICGFDLKHCSFEMICYATVMYSLQQLKQCPFMIQP